eukprot:3322796-Amphidinium_carterae.2
MRVWASQHARKIIGRGTGLPLATCFLQEYLVKVGTGAVPIEDRFADSLRGCKLPPPEQGAARLGHWHSECLRIGACSASSEPKF